MAVAPEYQGRGVGRSLVLALFALVRAAGGGRVWCISRSVFFFSAAIGFYYGLGMRCAGPVERWGKPYFRMAVEVPAVEVPAALPWEAAGAAAAARPTRRHMAACEDGGGGACASEQPGCMGGAGACGGGGGGGGGDGGMHNPIGVGGAGGAADCCGDGGMHNRMLRPAARGRRVPCAARARRRPPAVRR